MSDDRPLILEHPYTKKIADWPAIFTSGHYAGSGGYRPLVTLSFAVNYLVGGENPLGYHAVNVALHALNSALVYLPLSSSFSIAFPGPGRSARFRRSSRPYRSSRLDQRPSRTNGDRVFSGRMVALFTKCPPRKVITRYFCGFPAPFLCRPAFQRKRTRFPRGADSRRYFHRALKAGSGSYADTFMATAIVDLISAILDCDGPLLPFSLELILAAAPACSFANSIRRQSAGARAACVAAPYRDKNSGRLPSASHLAAKTLRRLLLQFSSSYYKPAGSGFSN